MNHMDKAGREGFRFRIPYIGIEYISRLEVISPMLRGYANIPGTLRSVVDDIGYSPEELHALDKELRYEFGPFVITLERVKEVRTMLALADIEARSTSEVELVKTQRVKLLSLLSPMRKLPNETLLHIFQHPGHLPPTQMRYPVITYLPSMAISSICYRWRALALSSPSLWANIAVETLLASLDEVENQVGFIDTVTRYLERSGDSPLRLDLTISGSPDSNDEVLCLVQLMQHAYRWKVFEFSGSHPFAEYSVPSDLHFPSLAEVNIIQSDGLGHFEHFPKLCVLSTRKSVGPLSRLYNQLDHLTFYGDSWTDSVEALRSCPSLKSLTFDYINHGPLEVTWCHDNIASLDLGISMSDLDLIAVLRVMPALLDLQVNKKLRFHVYSSTYQNPITSHLLLTLTHDPSTSISLVPKLHSLDMRYTSVDPFDDAAFISMIKSRWIKPGSDLSVEMLAMGRSSLRSVVLKLDEREVDADIYKPLRILDAEGLRVVVSGTNGVQYLPPPEKHANVLEEDVTLLTLDRLASKLAQNVRDLQFLTHLTVFHSTNTRRAIVLSKHSSLMKTIPLQASIFNLYAGPIPDLRPFEFLRISIRSSISLPSITRRIFQYNVFYRDTNNASFVTRYNVSMLGKLLGLSVRVVPVVYTNRYRPCTIAKLQRFKRARAASSVIHVDECELRFGGIFFGDESRYIGGVKYHLESLLPTEGHESADYATPSLLLSFQAGKLFCQRLDLTICLWYINGLRRVFY
ncbi:hypothetical protein BDP27DRAFT_1370454 [Rhodocollybia butyracea]|uniref:F-box domain-containing protein n=1 Tax=Rhodocollybia butyracea TaxID=206335 RepID=A0A9P5P7X1_9AGAR|nr:hypothetical protein BDP27DRAFT_1370454 [Rhodocollybia butyracea]